MFGDDRELHAYLQRLVGSMLSAEVSDQSVLAGGDVIRARRMRQDNVEFAATLLLATDHRPNITGRDDGIWRRIRAPPCDRDLRHHPT